MKTTTKLRIIHEIEVKPGTTLGELRATLLPAAESFARVLAPLGQVGRPQVLDDRDFVPLQLVFDLAREMSHCSSYSVLDDNGEYLGVDPEIAAALESVQRTFGLVDDPRSEKSKVSPTASPSAEPSAPEWAEAMGSATRNGLEPISASEAWRLV